MEDALRRRHRLHHRRRVSRVDLPAPLGPPRCGRSPRVDGDPHVAGEDAPPPAVSASSAREASRGPGRAPHPTKNAAPCRLHGRGVESASRAPGLRAELRHRRRSAPPPPAPSPCGARPTVVVAQTLHAARTTTAPGARRRGRARASAGVPARAPSIAPAQLPATRSRASRGRAFGAGPRSSRPAAREPPPWSHSVVWERRAARGRAISPPR